VRTKLPFSFGELHNFFAAPAPSNIYAARSAPVPGPTLFKSKKVNITVGYRLFFTHGFPLLQL
jgi:hypothetical protein